MSDPHIHVAQNFNADAMARDMLASSFGLVSDLPSVVTTGCDLELPRAMTSIIPERVTCLACREYAHQKYLDYAEQVEKLAGTPGLEVMHARAREAAKQYRSLAAKFST